MYTFSIINTSTLQRITLRYSSLIYLGHPGGSIVPTNENLPPSSCSSSPENSHGAVNGSICDSSIDFRRFAWNKALPKLLTPLDAMLKNTHGTDAVPWKFKGITHPEGWTATVILGHDYQLSFRNLTQVTNISYSGSFYEFNTTDYVRMKHVFKQEPDYFTITGVRKNVSKTPPPPDAVHGDWGFVNETKTLTYLVSGKDNWVTINKNWVPKDVQLRVSKDNNHVSHII